MFDVHGQTAEPKAIFRGTQNGRTATRLVSRFGREALSGETSVFGKLAEQGLPVIPAIGSTDREHVDYDGGHIVNTDASFKTGCTPLEIPYLVEVPRGATGKAVSIQVLGANETPATPELSLNLPPYGIARIDRVVD